MPASGTYQIEAYGAKGGGDNGGLGAKIIGTFFLSQNEVINIIVGQSGTVTNQGFVHLEPVVVVRLTFSKLSKPSHGCWWWRWSSPVCNG